MHRSVGLAIMLLVTLTLFSACSGSPEVNGKYISEENPGDYLELKSDGTFYLEEEGMRLSGSYQVDGNEITLSLPIGIATKGRIEGNVLIDEDGERWVRAAAPSARSTGTPQPSPLVTPSRTTPASPLAEERSDTPSRQALRGVFAARPCRAVTYRFLFGDRPFCDNPGPYSNIYVANDDLSGITKIAEAAEQPHWSPDGQRLAFYSRASGDRGALYVVNADGTDLKRITPEKRDPRYFTWSPDSKFLFYATYTTGTELNVITSDGTTDARKILPGSYQNNALAYTWSSDGPKVAISYFSFGGNALIIQDFNTESRTVVVRQLPDTMVWSPNGTKLLYNLDDGNYVVSADGSSPTKVLPLWKSERFKSESYVRNLTWSNDGTKLVYSTLDGSVYVINADGTGDHKINDQKPSGGQFDLSPTTLFKWSPDGELLAYVTSPEESRMNLVVYNVDEALPDTTIEIPFKDPFQGLGFTNLPETLEWSPDGTVVFVAGDPTSGKAYLIDLAAEKVVHAANVLLEEHKLELRGAFLWQPIPENIDGNVSDPDSSSATQSVAIAVKRMQTGSGCSSTDPGPVETLDLEEGYLSVVVASENGAAGVPLEALKAQAVASRTFALYKMQYEPRSASFDVCDTEADQVYNPSMVVRPEVQRAVEGTEGIAAKWNGEVIAAFFVKGDVASGTAQYVTVNEGKTGGDIAPTPLGSPDNRHNRGAMSQDKANELAEQGWDYQRILRYFYGADLELSSEPR